MADSVVFGQRRLGVEFHQMSRTNNGRTWAARQCRVRYTLEVAERGLRVIAALEAPQYSDSGSWYLAREGAISGSYRLTGPSAGSPGGRPSSPPAPSRTGPPTPRGSVGPPRRPHHRVLRPPEPGHHRPQEGQAPRETPPGLRTLEGEPKS